MADSVVSFLLQNLSQLLAHEAKLLCGAEDRIRSLHNELEMIHVYLKTSEGKKSKNEIEQKVVSQIRDVAQVTEDVIDTFVANVAIHKRRSMLGRMIHSVDHAKLLHDVAEKIDNIKTTIMEIRENKIKYGFPESSDQSTSAREEEERTQSLHQLRRLVEEEDVVGFAQNAGAVIKRLMEGGQRRKVVSIIGMGGLGKTTLTRKVYNSNQAKQYFDCRAWVYVSNEFRAREVLLGLLKHLMPNAYECRYGKKVENYNETFKPRDFSRLSEDELKIRVRECLKGKRYLLVLDDLWKKLWDEVQDAFPDESVGRGRILITSRLKEVALHTSVDPPYYLQFLSEEQSWELFSRKVFRGEECPSDLEPLGKRIVQSCRGLPLSIVVLAGLLANKEKSHREWSKVVGNVNWYLTRDETQVKDIVLKLSYDNLPRRLKPCFLYLGIFPEDSEIRVRQLLERWVAEGFIQETGSRNPDDVAEDYLYELIDRCLVQIARVKSSGVKTCRIHDLLRDLCISESKEDKVFEVCTDDNILIPTKPRRLSIHCSMARYISSNGNDHSCVRSFFSFDPYYYFASSEWKWLSKDFKLVRVLILMGKFCRKIPSNLGDLIHLRYLRIDSEFIRSIPDSICNLQNLQTLDLGPSVMLISISFPDRIWKLKHLRHLYTYGPIMLRGNHSKSDGDVMWNLQTISSITLDSRTASLIEKGRFPKLRKLGLHISSNCETKLPERLLSLQRLSHLNKLEIDFRQKDYTSTEWNISCRPQELLQSLEHLRELSVLKIVNALNLLTCGASFPPNITKLTLAGIRYLNGDGMNALGNLTKLQILRLSGALWFFDSFDLECIAGGFPQLRVFHMRYLGVKNWELAKGAMPLLQSLIIEYCSSLASLPDELWYLNDLRRVHVRKPCGTLAPVLRNLETKDGCELIIESEI